MNGYLDFPYLGQVARIERVTTDLEGNVVKGRKRKQELVFVVSSLDQKKASPARLLELNRGHWEIENRLHYVRDWTFDEDRSQVRRGNGPRAMASLRNAAISLLRLAEASGIAAAIRELSRKPEAILTLIGL